MNIFRLFMQLLSGKKGNDKQVLEPVIEEDKRITLERVEIDEQCVIYHTGVIDTSLIFSESEDRYFKGVAGYIDGILVVVIGNRLKKHPSHKDMGKAIAALLDRPEREFGSYDGQLIAKDERVLLSLRLSTSWNYDLRRDQVDDVEKAIYRWLSSLEETE